MNAHKGDPITSYEAAAAIEPHRFWDRVKFGISVRHVYEICLGRSWREKPRETQKALL